MTNKKEIILWKEVNELNLIHLKLNLIYFYEIQSCEFSVNNILHFDIV